ncbi:MAG: spermidine/putrescine ABC transporter substrate-binding protein [Bryobacterales bacterium]|nr:spermidine/putrescine ABC transporter substrate-binding protein [Bryobacterales bacterium]
MTRRTLFFLALSGLAGCRRSSLPRLNIFNWSDYVAPDTIPNFTKEFGVDVRYSVYESNEEMLAKVFSGNSGWDIVFPSNYFIEPMRANRLLAELDHSRLPNLSSLDARLRNPEWDPQLQHSVPYMWGAAGIVYQKSLAPAPTSWADLWDARFKGRLTMLDDPADTLGAALKKVGLSINTHQPDEMRRGQVELIRQKAIIRAYLNAEARDQVIAGDLLAAHLWATTSAQAIEAAPDRLAFAYPTEGFALYADNAVILRESSRPELAHQFLNYLLRPEVAAAIVNVSRTATANGAARDLLPQELRENHVLYPDAATLQRGEWFAPLPSAAQRLRDRLWTEVKSA